MKEKKHMTSDNEFYYNGVNYAVTDDDEINRALLNYAIRTGTNPLICEDPYENEEAPIIYDESFYGEQKPKKDVCWNYKSCKKIVIKDKQIGDKQCSICKGYVCPRCGNCHCTNFKLQNRASIKKKKREAIEKFFSSSSLTDTELKELREDLKRVKRLQTNISDENKIKIEL